MKVIKGFIILIILSSIFSLYYFRENIKKSPIFKLKKVVISEVPHYSFEYLLKIIDVKKDISVFELDLNEIKDKLSRLPWIKEIKVTRILPDRLSIALTEHKIRGVILLDILYFYDNDFKIFLKAYPSETKDSVIYSGLTLNEYEENFNVFKDKLKKMENITVDFNNSELKKSCSLKEINITLFKGYESIVKCKDNNFIKIVMGNNDFLKEFNRSNVILKKNEEKKEKLTVIMFNELKNKNSVIIKIDEEEEI